MAMTALIPRPTTSAPLIRPMKAPVTNSEDHRCRKWQALRREPRPITPLSASTPPTERSSEPPTITSVTAAPAITTGTSWTRMLRRLPIDPKAGVVNAKKK